MKARLTLRVFVLGSVALALLASPSLLRAQAPAGPLPAATPQPSSTPTAKPQNQVPPTETRASILGAWRLNRDDSDDARKKMQDARGNRGGGHGGGGGVHVGGGVPGMGGHGGYGGRRGENEDDRQRAQELFRPPNSLTLARKDAEVDLTDDQNRKRAFFTDGRKLQKPNSKDDSYQEIAAHWDGSRLVSDEKTSRGEKMSRTFELSYDGKQLYETLHMTSGRSNTPLVIRFVYDPAPPPQS